MTDVNNTPQPDIDMSEENFTPVVYNVLQIDDELWFQLTEGVPEDDTPFRVVNAEFNENNFLEIQVETLDGTPASDILYHYAARIVVQSLREMLEEVEDSE